MSLFTLWSGHVGLDSTRTKLQCWKTNLFVYYWGIDVCNLCYVCSHVVNNINWKDSATSVLHIYKELIYSGLRIWMFRCIPSSVCSSNFCNWCQGAGPTHSSIWPGSELAQVEFGFGQKFSPLIFFSDTLETWTHALLFTHLYP